MPDDQFNEQIIISADTTGALNPLQQLEQTTKAIDEAGQLMGSSMQRALLVIETGAPRAVTAFASLTSSVQGVASQVNLLNTALAQTLALMAQMRGLGGGVGGRFGAPPWMVSGTPVPLALGPSSALVSTRLPEIPIDYRAYARHVPIYDVTPGVAAETYRAGIQQLQRQQRLMLGPGAFDPLFRGSPEPSAEDFVPYRARRAHEYYPPTRRDIPFRTRHDPFGLIGEPPTAGGSVGKPPPDKGFFDDLPIDGGSGSVADAQRNVMLSMIRHVAVYWLLFRAVQATISAMQTLTQRFLDVDSAARRIQFITGGTYAQGQQAAMAGMRVAAQYGLDPQATIAASIQAARFAPTNQAYQAQLLDMSARISLLTGESQTETMKQMIEIGRQWNLQQSDMGRLADIIAYTYRTSTVSMDQFTDSMAQGAAIGQALNLTMEETAGLIAGVAEASGRGPTRVITMLSMIAGLENRPEGEEKLWSLGISTRDVQGRVLPLLQILDQIHSKWDQMNKDQRAMAAIGLVGPRYVSDFAMLMNNYDAIIAKVNGVKNAHGDMARAIEANLSSIQTQANRVFPAIQALIVSSLVPTEEMANKWSDFFKKIADGAVQASARNTEPAVQALREANRMLDWGQRITLMAGGRLDDTWIEQTQGLLAKKYPDAAGFIQSPGFKYYLREYLGGRQNHILVEEVVRLGMEEWRKKQPQKGVPVQPTDTTKQTSEAETPEQSRLFKALTNARLTYKDITKQELDQQIAAAERMGDAYLRYLSQQYRGAELVEKQKEEWAQSATIIQTIDGQYTLITGKAAALLNITEQMNKAMRPSIQTVPELNQQTAGMLQQYITQYERLLTKLGIKQTPQEYLMFGQGGTLYKYVTSSEAMTLAMELLREEIRKNTDKLDEGLRGHYNIPTAFGYRPPTPWDYYAAGYTDMGPINYPWMFDQTGPVDRRGRPLIGTPATGITKEFPSTLIGISELKEPVNSFGIHVDKFGSYVNRLDEPIPPPMVSGQGKAEVGEEPLPYLFDRPRGYAYSGGASEGSAAGGGVSMQGMLSAIAGTQTNTAVMASRIPATVDRVGSGVAISNFLLQSISLQLLRIGMLLQRPINVTVYTSGVSGTAGATIAPATPAAVGAVGTGQGFASANSVSAMRA